jgi:ribosomal protein L11 methyltransferase
VIDPGGAFGTGAHATTRLALELLLDERPGSVLDVGCGSGVLAIAAAKLGFAPVTAVDRDEAALDATRSNAAANGVDVAVRLADALTDALPPTDIALANIDRAAVESLGGRLDTRVLITSGYLRSSRPRLTGFAHRERRVREGWAADRWERE